MPSIQKIYIKTMKLTVLSVVILLLATSHALRMSQHKANSDLIVGGYSPLNASNLSEDAKEVDQFLRNLHSDLKDAKLISAERQVVAGFNYHYIYRSADGKTDWDFVVYKNLKGKLLENGYSFTQTLPNGQKVTAMADPASAFTGAYQPQPLAEGRVSSSAPVLTSVVEQSKPSQPVKPATPSAQQPVVYRDVFPNAISPRVIS